MRFEHPDLLWLLIPAVLGLAAFFWWAWRKRQQLIAQFVRSRLLAHLTVGLSARRRKTRMALLVAAVGLVVIAIARPQWGFDWQEARQRGLDIVVAIDTSRSMLAADIPPNRLARAKLAALDLKRIARPDRLGLVAFAGSAFLQCPLSFDDEAFRQSVNALDVNIIPVPGSAIAEAIETARSAFKEKNDNYKVLVLFTDGEDNDGRALEAAERAAKDDMLIFTIGVGTANGELLRITDAKGRTDFVRDEQGNVIKSRLNEDLLGKIARAGNGVYMLLSGANTMELLYERRLEPLPKSEFTARRVKRYHERYQWFLGAALVLVLAEMFMPERKRARRRAAAAAPPPLAKAAVALVLTLFPISVLASPNSALKKYHSGNYKSALREYERLLTDRPDEPRLHYNAGAAAFQTGDYERSIKHFNTALSAQDLELQQRAFYNLGNAQYRAGEQDSNPANKQTLWQDAIKNYDSALKLNPKDADAEYNRELVKKKLEELKKQQQQQNQQKQENEKKDEEKKDQQSKEDKDQKQDQSKPNEQQQEQQKSPDQKQEQQKKEEEQQQSKESEKQSKPEQQNKQPQGQEQGTNEQQNATSTPQQMLQMTPEQAQRLLQSMKSEEKVMIFVPQQGRTNRANRALKDW